MRNFFLVLAASALFQAGGLQAAEAEKRKGDLGSSWTNADGNTRHAQIRLRVASERNVTPGIYRPLSLDWRGGKLQQGPYPANIEADQEGMVRLQLDISEMGRIAKCEIIAPSEVAAFNDHACPHVTKYARFIPAMDTQGKRLAKSYKATVSYEVIPKMHMLQDSPYPSKYSRGPRALVSADLAMIGIGPDTPPPEHIHGISASLGVDETGKVTRCILFRATHNDSLDKQICDRLIANMRYAPAIGRESGKPMAATSSVYISWPKAGE